VAIVGRPNVGKSALFNRLTRSRLAIVEDVPGVTRDRLYGDGEAFGKEYVLIDTGGFDPDSDDPMTQSIVEQVQVALSEADAVICVFDGSLDPLPSDREAVRLLRETDLPVLFAANKIDNPARAHEAKQLYRLGVDRVFEISALHGHGIGDLEEALGEILPEPAQEAQDEDTRLTRVAIVGRPNAGKSSLVNRLLGETRQIVDNRPGTTVDSVDALYEDEAGPLVLIDTAGIRRKRSVKGGIEGLAVVQAIRAVERADTVVLMIDATEGASEQDAKIAGLALDRGRAVVLALNKMDLLKGKQRDEAVEKLRDVLNFMPWAPVRRVSAKTGRGVRSLMDMARHVAEAHEKRVTTGELNRFFEEVLERHPPPTSGGRAVRLYFVTQARTRPPTFVVSTNYPDRVHFSYKRYVINQLRERFGFEGTPIRVYYRGKGKRR
jgi:GTP-binding protein